jgi:2-polyprenyl-3-methyl-5-hydroxy-6-metoxy-1,4-benzoquinol methylase
MSRHHTIDVPKVFTQEFWDERYGSSERLWSGNPNQRLVEHTAGLAPGTALDIGCGEGADAIWLAARGWQVTGVDVSQVALDRASTQATRAGAEIASRTAWQRADLLTWAAEPRSFDLVTAHLMHLLPADREALHGRMAAAVRPGGTLLIVGHHPSDLETTVGRWNLPGFLFTAEEIAATLDPDDWRIVVAAAPAQQAADPEGRPVTIHDAVLRAERLQ